ncbi:hypothetical protein HMPREF0645_0181 [Hallella bergensis DSM 17361]|uniref:Uncharacterized protein n=1 Tax=Hallella bergensis DSM 17361 TaxID=585502 RepID=D1PT96_9BACT|nr:hypothetical protein HMPREF0645_0181 [Hallella bergensis DSM 17361]
MVVAKHATTTQHGAIEGKTQPHAVDDYNLDLLLILKSATKPLNVLLAFTRPLITEFDDLN